MSNYELIFVVVNQGYSEDVMDVARAEGARGGTILNARGTAKIEAERKFNIPIHPEKEIIMILALKSIKDKILHAIYKSVGLDTPGQGIAFTVPVDETAGIDGKTNLLKKLEEVEEKPKDDVVITQEEDKKEDNNDEGK